MKIEDMSEADVLRAGLECISEDVGKTVFWMGQERVMDAELVREVAETFLSFADGKRMSR